MFIIITARSIVGIKPDKIAIDGLRRPEMIDRVDVIVIKDDKKKQSKYLDLAREVIEPKSWWPKAPFSISQGSG